MIQRLCLALRNSAGLNKRDARLMHIVSDIPMSNEPSRYNLKTQSGTAKFTLNEDTLDVVHFRKENDGLKETAKIRFSGDENYLLERLVDMCETVKNW